MMPDKKSQELCRSRKQCGYIAFDRNRYFTGKYMTAREFRAEQDYFLSRHWLHNRLLHGWGIVCGLEVKPHPRPECKDRWVIVSPGIAIDCCGREIVLLKETLVQIWDPEDLDKIDAASTDNETPAQTSSAASNLESDSGQTFQPDPFLLYICYREVEIEWVPALHSKSSCESQSKEANFIRETAQLKVCYLDEVDPGCWSSPGGDEETPCIDDCNEQQSGPRIGCIKPHCSCGFKVPLAVIRPRDINGGFIIDEKEIDTQGRRYLKTSSESLTHIVDINWPHGSEFNLSKLKNNWNGRLEVRFDRKLEFSQKIGSGINEYTFVVQYAGIQRDLEFLAYNPDFPPTMEEDCRAVFTIQPEHLGDISNIAGNVVYVTLRCDFIFDCHGNPVDGNHLKGRLPTGNGIPGGDFVSWFRVVN